MQRANLGHHLRVDRETTGGIDDQHVGELRARFGNRALRNGDRRFVRPARDESGTHLVRQRLQLIDRGGAIHVGADDRHFLLLSFAQESRELGNRRRLTDALQTRHQNDRRRRRREIQLIVRRTHQLDELVIDEFHQRLAGREARCDFLPDRAHANALDEILHDAQRNVGFEQRRAHVAQRFVDVFIGQPRTARNGA